MKVTMKRIFALLVLCLLLVSLCAGSVAAVDLDKEVSLIMHLPLGDNGSPLAELGLVFDLYRVARTVPVAGYDSFAFQTIEGSVYDDYSVELYDEETDSEFTLTLNDLINMAMEGEYNWTNIAQMTLSLATGRWADFETPVMDDPVVTGAAFGHTLERLETGLYLVVARGEGMDDFLEWTTYEDAEGNEYPYQVSWAKDTDYKYIFAPQLVYMPGKPSNGGTVGPQNDWIYDVEAYLKVETEALSQKKLLLHKVAEDGRTSLPGATFDLYATRVASDEIPEDTITTYVDGIGYVTLYKIAQNLTTDSKGNIELPAPLWDDNTLYAWVETAAPSGYELDPTPQFCFAYVPGEYTDDYEDRYTDYLNNIDSQDDPLLRYDPANPNASGSVTFERYIGRGGMNVVQLSNAAGGQEVFIRVRLDTSKEGTYEGESLGSYAAAAFGDDWIDGGDGYYYYTQVLSGGEQTAELLINFQPEGYGDRIVGKGKDQEYLPYRARLAVVYDITPAQYDSDGNPYADWSLRPEDAVSDGIVADAEGDVKYAAQRHWVQSSYYNVKDPDGNQPVVMENKKSSDTSTPSQPQPGLELPETGGMGTTPFVIAGSGLVAIALFLLAVRRRAHD